MKNAATLALILIMAAVLPALAKGIKKETIALPTIQCGMCKTTIESKLKALKGMKSIDVDLEKRNATVEYDSKLLTTATIEKAIAALGYDANQTPANSAAQQKLNRCCQPGAHR